MQEDNKAESKKGGVTNKGSLYAHASKYTIQVIDFLFNTMQDEKVQMSVRVSAANKLLDKTLPDLKAAELTGKDGEPLAVNIIGSYVSPGGWNVPTPIGSLEGPDPLQSIGLAQESQEIINSPGEDQPRSA